MSVREFIKNNLAETDPDLWNTLVHGGLTEKILNLAETAYETGREVGLVGSDDSEDIERTLDRTCEAYATAYATFCCDMLRKSAGEVRPEFNSIQGQLAAAQGQAVPAFLRVFVLKLAENGIKPLDPNRIQVAQEVPSPVPPQGRLILP